MTVVRTTLLLLIVIGLSTAVFSQTKKPISKTGLPSATKSSQCVSGGFSFVCPKDNKVINSGTDGQPFVAIDAKEKLGLFASELKEKAKDDSLIAKALDSAFQSLYSKKYSELEIRESPDFWGNDKYSRFEESKTAKAAFNSDRTEFLHIHWVIINFNGKRVLAGFANVIAKGDGAEEWFRSWMGGGSGGDEELQDLIISITKEKKPKLAPGGPPPGI